MNFRKVGEPPKAAGHELRKKLGAGVPPVPSRGAPQHELGLGVEPTGPQSHFRPQNPAAGQGQGQPQWPGQRGSYQPAGVPLYPPLPPLPSQQDLQSFNYAFGTGLSQRLNSGSPSVGASKHGQTHGQDRLFEQAGSGQWPAESSFHPTGFEQYSSTPNMPPISFSQDSLDTLDLFPTGLGADGLLDTAGFFGKSSTQTELDDATAIFSASLTGPGTSRKRPRDSIGMRQRTSVTRFDSELPTVRDYASMARALLKETPPLTSVVEPASLVVDTEKAMGTLLPSNVDDVARSVRAVWTRDVVVRRTNMSDIGPSPNQTGNHSSPFGLQMAVYLADFMLTLYHPSSRGPRRDTVATGSRHGQLALATKTAPKKMNNSLLDWLNANHPIYDGLVTQTLSHSGPYTPNGEFWDMFQYCVGRAKFEPAISLLLGILPTRPSGHEQLFTPASGLSTAIATTASLLRSCPVNSDDWDLQGADWQRFRKEVRSSTEKFESFGQSDQISHLRSALAILLGSGAEVMSMSADWLEASVLLTVWWNGEAEQDFSSFRYSSWHVSGKGPKLQSMSVADANEFYRRRLFHAFANSTKQHGLAFNSTSNPVQVGLACLMTQQLDAAVELIASGSLAIGCSLVELGLASGWLENDLAASQSIAYQYFSKDDLNVLLHGQGVPDRPFTERLMSEYGVQLFDADLAGLSPGWKVGLGVLSRLPEQGRATELINQMLDKVDTSDPATLDLLLDSCVKLGRVEYGCRLADRHATAMAQKGLYGVALVYYARAGNRADVNNILNFLVSKSLIESREFPARAELDPQLRAFIDAPRSALEAISRSDLDAADMLSNHLSGYATIRLFYRLRDAEIEEAAAGGAAPWAKSAHSRRRNRLVEAAAALVACIESASNGIVGGLFDASIDTVLHVDSLIPLLGEAIGLATRPGKQLFNRDQLFSLVRAVEDLETVSTLIFDQSNEMVRASLRNCVDPFAVPVSPQPVHPPVAGNDLPFNPRASVLQARPDLFLLDRPTQSALSAPSTLPPPRPLVEIRRAWDWRQAMVESVGSGRRVTASAAELAVDGRDVLAILRVILAREIGKASISVKSWSGVSSWSNGEDDTAVGQVRFRGGVDGDFDDEMEGTVVQNTTHDHDGDVFLSKRRPVGGRW